MTPEIGGLILAAVFALLALNAYRDNQRSDASWERMRRDLTPVWSPPRAPWPSTPFNPSMYFASTSVMFPVIGTDTGYAHQHGYIPR